MEEMRDVKEYFKFKLMELLFTLTNAEMEGAIEKYITGIKHLIRYSWKYLSKNDRQYVREQITKMNEEIEKIKQDGVNRTKLLDIKYQYYDNLFNYVISSLLDSSLIEEENFGVITFEDENDIEHVTQLIKNKKLFKKLMEVKDEDDISSV